MSRIRPTALLGSVALLITALSGCTRITTEPDQVALHYDAGPISATKFHDCVHASTQNYNGPGDKYFVYPSGQRTYDFTGDEGAESKPLTVTSKDNVQLTVSGSVTFNLNTACDVLRRFHEQIGLKYQAYDPDGADTESDGWKQLLNVYVGQQVQRALNAGAQQYGWIQLYNDPTVRTTFQQQVAGAVPGLIKQQAGDDYFEDFALTIGKPTPPDSLVASLAAAQQAVTDLQAVKNRNLTVAAQAQQINQLVKELGPYGYILYRSLDLCAQDSTKCPTVLPVPQGTSLNVNGGSATAAK